MHKNLHESTYDGFLRIHANSLVPILTLRPCNFHGICIRQFENGMSRLMTISLSEDSSRVHAGSGPSANSWTQSDYGSIREAILIPPQTLCFWNGNRRPGEFEEIRLDEDLYRHG